MSTVSTPSDVCGFYKVSVQNEWKDGVVESLFVHTDPNSIKGNYMVLGLTRHIKHSMSASKVLCYAQTKLSGLDVEVVFWKPPLIMNQGSMVPFKAPLCIEVGFREARNVVSRLFENKELSVANFGAISFGLSQLEEFSLRLDNNKI